MGNSRGTYGGQEGFSRLILACDKALERKMDLPLISDYGTPNNGMQRSAGALLVMFLQSGRAPADAGRYVLLLS
jgi:hypothetical protein